MTRVLILAHSPLATALKAVGQHTYADCIDQVDAVDVEPSETPEGLMTRLLPLVQGEPTLVLCDMPGATPCNVALALAQANPMAVVAGVNIPMLWRTLCYRHEPLQALKQRALEGAQRGVIDLTPIQPT